MTSNLNTELFVWKSGPQDYIGITILCKLSLYFISYSIMLDDLLHHNPSYHTYYLFIRYLADRGCSSCWQARCYIPGCLFCAYCKGNCVYRVIFKDCMCLKKEWRLLEVVEILKSERFESDQLMQEKVQVEVSRDK